MKIKVYTLPSCVRCGILKDELNKRKIDFLIAEMDTAESITEMRVESCFAIEAPVLAIIENDDNGWKFFYGEELFPNGKLDLKIIESIK
jgi:hypothetical protein